MKSSSIKLSKIFELNKNIIDNFNFNRKSLINEKNFNKQADIVFNKLKKDKFDCLLSYSNAIKKKIIVVSHERSGTHYLMNAIAYNSNYTVHPFIPCSPNLGINFFYEDNIIFFFSMLEKYKIANIFKSHHNFVFFKKNFDYLKKHYFFIYIYRDPRDIITSFWNFLNTYPWVGPKKDSISELLRSQPEGTMIQYQIKQNKGILDRWEQHIKSWMLNNYEKNKKNILFIKYEDLNLSYEKTLNEIFLYLNIELKSTIRPSTSKDVLAPGRGKVGNYRFFLDKKDIEFIKKNVGKTMDDLGYSI